MDVLIDASPAAYQTAGIGRYVRGLLRGLRQHTEVGTAYFYYGSVKGCGLPTPLWEMALGLDHRRYRLLLLAHYYLGRQLRATGSAHLFHATDFVGPRFLDLPSVVTVHDLSFLTHPEWHAPLNALPLRWLVPRAVSEAAHVIAVSSWVASQLVARLHLHPAKVSVVYEGFDSLALSPPEDWNRRLEALGLQEGYILSVGTWEPRKNYVRLLEAYSFLAKSLGDVPPLVVCGNPGWKYRHFLQAVNLSPLRHRIRLISGADDATLAALYRGCGLFVLPSLDEGFGLPVLEAMASGAPVAASQAGAIPEVGGDAVLYFDPLDPEDIASKLALLLEDAKLRGDLKTKGLTRSQAFSWEATAKATAELYRRTAG